MSLEFKTIRLRFVEVSDAAFILKLRLDDRYNQFLSNVSPEVESQKNGYRRIKLKRLKVNSFTLLLNASMASLVVPLEYMICVKIHFVGAAGFLMKTKQDSLHSKVRC